MPTVVSTLDMTREQWLAVRRQGLGGSDAASVMGMNPWKSPMMVYLEKRGEVEDQEVGEAAYWGTALEAIIADEFKTQTGFHVQRRNAILSQADRPWMIANVDRLIRADQGEWGILEVKTANQFKAGEWDSDTAPDAYVIQLQHYLAVTGYQYGYLAVLIGGQRYRHIRVERDQDLIDSMIQIEFDFWQGVQNGTPPGWSGMDCDQELLDRMYPTSRPQAIELPPTVEKFIGEYEQAKADEKDAETRKNAAEANIKLFLGDNEVGIYGDRKVSWKTVSASRFDSAKFKAAHPATHAEYAKESTSRRFTCK